MRLVVLTNLNPNNDCSMTNALDQSQLHTDLAAKLGDLENRFAEAFTSDTPREKLSQLMQDIKMVRAKLALEQKKIPLLQKTLGVSQQ